MDKIQAKAIIQNAVELTEPRWIQYAESWKNIDVIFILRGYEQQGLELFKMRPELERLGMLSIERLGAILLRYPEKRSYERKFAGSYDSEFYLDLRKGVCGQEGILFAEAAQMFLAKKLGNPGRTYWKLLYEMLQACFFLKQNYLSSFAKFVISKYKKFCGRDITENDFLKITIKDWDMFLTKSKPWKDIIGIGPNVFDFLFGDIRDARFVDNSYKFDSSNQHFLNVTGIYGLIEPFNREGTSRFLRDLNMHYTLREINKGIYTYCSKTEGSNYGFCYDLQKCKECKVIDLCYKNFNGSTRIELGSIPKQSKADISPQIQKKSRDNVIYSNENSLIWKELDQEKYLIEKIFMAQDADLSVRKNLLIFHRDLIANLDLKGYEWSARTHKVGITYLCSKKKAFIFVNVNPFFLTLKYFSGNKSIGGLTKGIWVTKNDNLGTEPFRIISKENCSHAIQYAIKAYEIAVNF